MGFDQQDDRGAAADMKFAAFREYFSRINSFSDAYGSAADAMSKKHRAGTEQLFKESQGFLERVMKCPIESVLDVGMGYGQHCRYFAAHGIQTTGITTHCPPGLIEEGRRDGYTVLKMDMHDLRIADDTFDCLWSHHSLEHSFSPLYALREWLRVIKPGGYLAVSVPPHNDYVVSGHFNVGWNVGQLIYMLTLAGYVVMDGYFAQDGYNVRGLVRKPTEPTSEDGLAWLVNIKSYLPPALQRTLIENPNSLGRYTYCGTLKSVTGETSKTFSSDNGKTAHTGLNIWNTLKKYFGHGNK